MAILNTESQRIVLASRSPRRIQLMKKIVSHFETMISDVDETFEETSAPQSIAIRLAVRKAEKVALQIDSGLIIGADSIVVIDGEILGKPKDEQQSKEMLRKLSGKSHIVYTGICVLRMPDRKSLTDFSGTKVKFRALEEWEILEYIRINKPFDKAGSYGIQDDAAVFVEEIHGCYYNVVGLPVAKVYSMVKKLLEI